MKTSGYFDAYYSYEEHICVSHKKNRQLISVSRDSYFGSYDHDQTVECIEAALRRGTFSVASLASRKYCSVSAY